MQELNYEFNKLKIKSHNNILPLDVMQCDNNMNINNLEEQKNNLCPHGKNILRCNCLQIINPNAKTEEYYEEYNNYIFKNYYNNGIKKNKCSILNVFNTDYEITDSPRGSKD